MDECPGESISRRIWDEKYRYRSDGKVQDNSIEDTWIRVAGSLAAVEKPELVSFWFDRFRALLTDFKFLPGGRIQAGAGTSQQVTLFNCFVMGPIEDSVTGIFDSLKESALTLQRGGGIGLDFSPLRPGGTAGEPEGTVASGPVSFMHIWDGMCATQLASGSRRGAMMTALRCDHPDIEEFIDAKRNPKALHNFNLSVLISDAFMDAVERDASWSLRFPAQPGSKGIGEPARYHSVIEVSARQLWRKMMLAAYETGDPGVVFIDRINRSNNLWYGERISATNPCGEIPLPPLWRL